MPSDSKSVEVSKWRLPTYRHKKMERPEKTDQMYTVKWPPFHNEVTKKINSVLEPLSLFTPSEQEKGVPEGKQKMELERPVTPIDEEIKHQPRSVDLLAKYVRRRIAAKPDVPYLSVDDQRNLAGILMGEVNMLWPEIKTQIDDPFLSAEENCELNRRIAVHIVTVCEKLFHHYIQKAQVLNERGIFSGPANMSRLKAQLSLDADKFLNILTIRRYIVEDIRGKTHTDEDEIVYKAKPSTAAMQKQALSFKKMFEESRPKSKTVFYHRTANDEAREILQAMPDLDTSKLMNVISELPDRELQTPSQASTTSPPMTAERMSKASGVSKEDASKQKVILKRSLSLPHLKVGENLLEELGISPSVKEDKLSEIELQMLRRQAQKKQQISTKTAEIKPKGPQPGTREYAAEDLKKLISRGDQDDIRVEEDLPPLLQAITRHAKYDGLAERLEKQMKELEEEEKKEKEKENKPLKKPKHPQPDTVSAKLPGMDVRTSDIRVSERVCMSSITIDRFSTVYNDLKDEISPSTVKSLDKNLFLSDEIKEVYKEIMKTINTDHLNLDDDELVMPAADKVTLTGTMASSTLSKRRADRVINPNLRKDKNPPWGEIDPKQWVRTPANPPKNFLGDDMFAPMTPNAERIHDHLHNPSKMSLLLVTDHLPRVMAEKNQRTYASWLQWWKSTVTSDDYMKYLSTMESDYMGVAFHFYDSDEEEGEEEDLPLPNQYMSALGQSQALTQQQKQFIARTAHSAKQAENRRRQRLEAERQKKMQELKKEKTKYEEGMWNVNTVFMGGLGKDPQMEEEEDIADKGQKSPQTSRSAKTLQERVAARHSAKLQVEKPTRDLSHSRASKVTSMTGTISKMDTDRSGETTEEGPLGPQERLEKVWNALEMPDNFRLDMAIKYSSNEYYVKMFEAIERWELATELIQKREEFLGKLEKFERAASDPNRFFEKVSSGVKGSSVKRLQEAKQRSFYYKRIDHFDKEIKIQIDYMKKNFLDTVSYKGRSYEEKMKWDRIEMLYWLQEERKQNAIKYEALMRHIPYKVRQVQLDPIPMLPEEKVA
ncbi:coiled-coil domain-containing protein 87-like isoform X1 [Mytilus californianus]|uniref:coiled-coil domain-containing protein 87-like isoform X1 n=1 Tax=Mytilus californianus TaxID=6549 RepID=UPI0022470EFA|nr:coiled-coil domain-containing protein 87-like isoform X1 [Mytilus californianus]